VSLIDLILWLHLVTAIFLVGYALFWTIVALPPAERSDAASRNALLDELRSATWPPFGPLRLPLPYLGWLGLAGMGVTGWLLIRAGGEPAPAKLFAFAIAALLHVLLSLRPRPPVLHAFTIALLCTVVLAVVPRPTYSGVLLASHRLAVVIWLGHMFFWSFVVGPLCKRYRPEARRETIREASHRLGALGGSALLVLFLTGTLLLLDRGDVPAVLPWKLGLVGLMVLYQVFVGHRRAPRLVYANMLAALLILALSVTIVHGS